MRVINFYFFIILYIRRRGLVAWAWREFAVWSNSSYPTSIRTFFSVHCTKNCFFFWKGGCIFFNIFRIGYVSMCALSWIRFHDRITSLDTRIEIIHYKNIVFGTFASVKCSFFARATIRKMTHSYLSAIWSSDYFKCSSVFYTIYRCWVCNTYCVISWSSVVFLFDEDKCRYSQKDNNEESEKFFHNKRLKW